MAIGRADRRASLFLTFGPTAAVENGRAPEPVTDPDYAKIFVTRLASHGDNIDRITQTDVGLDEVLNGLPDADSRLLDALLALSGD